MFRNNIYEYLRIKNEIKKNNQENLNLRKRCAILENEMIKYMQEHDHEGIKINSKQLLVLEYIEPRKNKITSKKNLKHMIDVMKDNGVKNPNYLVNEINSTLNEENQENKTRLKIKNIK